MKQIQINIDVEVLAMDELPSDERELVEQAVAATDNAYAPYSNFFVGAAARLDNNLIVTGANQENAAFPSGLCAERTALFAAQAQYPENAVTALAIAARNADGLLVTPISPCGACRQVILGVEDRYKNNIKILLYGKSGVYRLSSARDLLPFSFVDACMTGDAV